MVRARRMVEPGVLGRRVLCRLHVATDCEQQEVCYE